MKCRIKLTGVLVVLLLIALVGGTTLLGGESDLLQSEYYMISLGAIEISLESLIQSAKEGELAVIVASDEQVVSYRGSDLTDESEEILLDADALLYVDHSWFLLQMAGQDLDYVVRPAEVGYTLLLSPHRDLPQGETLLAVLGELQQIGIVGEEVQMEWEGAFPKGTDKSPEHPDGVAIDSALYGLTIAEDWFAAAASQDLTRVGLHVEVVAEKLPGAAIPVAFQANIVSETDELAKLLIPIHRLVELAGSNAVSYVRPPYQPYPVAP